MVRKPYVYYLVAGLDEDGIALFAQIFQSANEMMVFDIASMDKDGVASKALIAEIDEDRPFEEVKDLAMAYIPTILTNRQLVYEHNIHTQAVVFQLPETA